MPTGQMLCNDVGQTGQNLVRSLVARAANRREARRECGDPLPLELLVQAINGFTKSGHDTLAVSGQAIEVFEAPDRFDLVRVVHRDLCRCNLLMRHLGAIDQPPDQSIRFIAEGVVVQKGGACVEAVVREDGANELSFDIDERATGHDVFRFGVPRSIRSPAFRSRIRSAVVEEIPMVSADAILRSLLLGGGDVSSRHRELFATVGRELR